MRRVSAGKLVKRIICGGSLPVVQSALDRGMILTSHLEVQQQHLLMTNRWQTITTQTLLTVVSMQITQRRQKL
jgi:hypothetical protein